MGRVGPLPAIAGKRTTAVSPFIITNAALGTDYTITTSGAYTYYNFLSSTKTAPNLMTLTNATAINVSYIAIAGGGGGGSAYAGGGGAGGKLQGSFSLTPGVRTITIGAGGQGGYSPTSGLFNLVNYRGDNGLNTSFGSLITAQGGGGGSGYQAASPSGSSGGCGGGGGYSYGAPGGATQGYAGGRSLGGPTWVGGGGGVDGIGQNSGTVSGAGGIGTTYNNGTALELGGGGGGGGFNAPGGLASFGGGVGGANNGTVNTGGGGGGAIANSGGGSGGSGIFIISYM